MGKGNKGVEPMPREPDPFKELANRGTSVPAVPVMPPIPVPPEPPTTHPDTETPLEQPKYKDSAPPAVIEAYELLERIRDGHLLRPQAYNVVIQVNSVLDALGREILR